MTLAGGYMRVSRQGDRDPDKWLTIDIQRDAIVAGCQREGFELVEMREDIDVSGGAGERPNLEDLVQRIEHGELQALVVGKLDRFSRDLVYGGLVIQRIEKAGGTFYAADDGVLVTADKHQVGGDETRLQLDIMLSLATYQLRRFKAQWRDTRKRTIARGVHWGPTPPLGYTRQKGEGLQLDPATAVIVREIFYRYIGGQDKGQILRWVTDLGIRTGRGGQPTHSYIRGLLKNRVYLGEARSGEFINPDAHEAIVDQATFDQAQDRQGPPAARYPDRPTPILSGMLRCWSCGRTMTAGWNHYAGGPRRMYRCRKLHARGICDGPASVMEHHVLPMVIDAFWRILDGDIVAHQAAAELPIDELRNALASASAELAAYRDNTLIADALNPLAYADGLRVRQARVDAAQCALEDAIKTSRKPDIDAASIREQWDDLTSDQRRRLLQATIGLIAIKPATGRHGDRHLGDRSRLLLVDDVPADLPRSGFKSTPVAALAEFDDPAGAWVTLREDLLPDPGNPGTR